MEKLKNELGQFCKEGRLKIKLLNWFRHAIWMEKNSKPRQIMKAQPEGRRTRGSSRKTCMDSMKKWDRSD